MPGQLRVYKYHGNAKKIDIDSLVGYDVVLTTYATIALEVAKRSSIFQKIRWFRVVLDEGVNPSVYTHSSSSAETRFR